MTDIKDREVKIGDKVLVSSKNQLLEGVIEKIKPDYGFPTKYDRCEVLTQLGKVKVYCSQIFLL